MEIISKLNRIQDTYLKPIDGQGIRKKERATTITCLTPQNREEGKKETKWDEQPETLKTQGSEI
jgi:Tfp pilus assembly major pilin PilA